VVGADDGDFRQRAKDTKKFDPKSFFRRGV
jgi:hypothetical protein